MHLVDYKVRVVNARAGTAARVRVVIESRDDDDVWGTVGVSENIIEASWLALVDSIEYKLFKDSRQVTAEAGHDAAALISATRPRPRELLGSTSMATELPKAYDPQEAQQKWLDVLGRTRLLPQPTRSEREARTPSSSRRRT